MADIVIHVRKINSWVFTILQDGRDKFLYLRVDSPSGISDYPSLNKAGITSWNYGAPVYVKKVAKFMLKVVGVLRMAQVNDSIKNSGAFHASARYHATIVKYILQNKLARIY